MIRLYFHSGPQAGRIIVTASPLIRIGRDPERSDVVLEDEQVSGRHALLQRSPRGNYVLEDSGSTNGTFVNGERMVELGRPMAVYLAPGDRFRIGASEIEIGEARARLMFVGGPQAGREVPLDERLITIGRAADNVLELDDPQVSVYHGVVRVTPLGFEFEDHDSTNGSTINGHPVKSQVLSDGDTLQIGSTQLSFLVDVDRADRTAAEQARTGQAAAGGAAGAAGAGAGPGDAGALASLVFVAGPHEGKGVALGEGQVVLGRRDGISFTIDDLQVSAVHCAVTREGSEFWITDLGSTNGTYVNGQRIDKGTRLGPGDLVQLGNSVAELRYSGGKAAGPAGLTALTTIMAEGAYAVASQPKFLIGNNVVSAARVTLGRAPDCDLRVEGFGVSKVHCTITWSEDGFYLEDSSSHGTYLNDRRIVREKLATGHVIRVGVQMINVTVRGERCTLEVIDAVTAMAAIEVAREVAVRADQMVPDPANAGGAAREAYKTVFKLELPDTEALVRERKAKFKQGAPAWRPSTDILKEPVGKIAVSSAVLTALVVVGVLALTSPAQALLDHPLSQAHASQLFADQAAKLGVSSTCAACHSAGNGTPDSKCVACHEGYGPSVRPEHKGAVGGCAGCHLEHKGTPRFDAHGVPQLLGAGGSCAADGCHPHQHQAEFLRSGPPPPLSIKAGPVPSFSMPQREFHVAHAQVDHGGVTISIGCTACHAARDPKRGTLVEAVAGKSCFRCHEGGEEHVNAQCGSCHKDEHRGVAHLARVAANDPRMAPATPPPTAGRSLGLGGGLAVAAFLPLLAVSLVLRARRGRRQAKVVEEMRAHPVEMVKRLVHSINVEKCVGCALCVQACPTSVLELVNHKSVVVNFDACIQCKKCESACAFDALRMHEADKPPPMVQMPEVDRHYQTPVKGMYLIGQAAGTPQVKNAVNLGRAVVQHMTLEGMRPGAGPAVGAQVDVVIVGSGPGGLSAALSCIQAGLSFVVLEKQRATAWTIRNYYHKGKPVMAEPHDIELAGLLPHWDTNREELLAAWDQAVAQHGVRIEFQKDVVDVARQGEVFHVQVAGQGGAPAATYTGARVVLAIGTMGNPRKLGCPGEDLEKVRNALVDPDEFRGKNILVVGGTDSAIEVVLALCENNRVWLSCRGAKFDRVKPKNLQAIEAAIAAQKCIPMFATAAGEVGEGYVVLTHKQDGRPEQLPNDVVFAMIGGHPPVKWLQGIGVPYVDKPHSWSPPRTDDLCKETAPS